MIVPGGWFMERDGFTGNSYTAADFMYLRIARRAVAAGFVVARYDNRGVSGNELSLGLGAESNDPKADAEKYLHACIDAELRRSVTPESLAADAGVVYQHLTRHGVASPSNIVVFAHSEGGFHVARLIAAERIDPQGLLFAAVTARSPSESFRWQMVDRYVQQVLTWDGNGDGRVTKSDVIAGYESSMFPAVGITERELYPTSDCWREADLREYFAARYEAEKRAALETDDHASFPRLEENDFQYVAASYRWWKQWFIDDRSTLELLSKYDGHLSFHFGELDSQIAVPLDVRYIDEYSVSMRRRPSVVVHRSAGHAFRVGQPTDGPMDKQSEDRIVADIIAMLRAE